MNTETIEVASARSPKGSGSFSVPRAAIDALLEARATAHEVCAYLTLACFTDGSGRYSTAGIKAVASACSSSKAKGGPIREALENLQAIPVYRYRAKSDGSIEKEDQGPLVRSRDDALALEGGVLPDGPSDRAKVRFVLSDFGESASERVWFGNSLVLGHGLVKNPLKFIRDSGDEAARLLLALYASSDMETWGGVRPNGAPSGPWVRYNEVDRVEVSETIDLIKVRRLDGFEIFGIDKRIAPVKERVVRAIEALLSSGLFYEVVTLINREIEFISVSEGELTRSRGAVPFDAAPVYEIYGRSLHGPLSKGEKGLAVDIAKAAAALDEPVWDKHGQFNGQFGAFVRKGFPCGVVGILRPRFRVTNPKNLGVGQTWGRIQESTREARALVRSVLQANGFSDVTADEASQHVDPMREGA